MKITILLFLLFWCVCSAAQDFAYSGLRQHHFSLSPLQWNPAISPTPEHSEVELQMANLYGISEYSMAGLSLVSMPGSTLIGLYLKSLDLPLRNYEAGTQIALQFDKWRLGVGISFLRIYTKIQAGYTVGIECKLNDDHRLMAYYRCKEASLHEGFNRSAESALCWQMRLTEHDHLLLESEISQTKGSIHLALVHAVDMHSFILSANAMNAEFSFCYRKRENKLNYTIDLSYHNILGYSPALVLAHEI